MNSNLNLYSAGTDWMKFDDYARLDQAVLKELKRAPYARQSFEIAECITEWTHGHVRMSLDYMVSTETVRRKLYGNAVTYRLKGHDHE